MDDLTRAILKRDLKALQRGIGARPDVNTQHFIWLRRNSSRTR